jgi:hypothetical protein
VVFNVESDILIHLLSQASIRTIHSTWLFADFTIIEATEADILGSLYKAYESQIVILN